MSTPDESPPAAPSRFVDVGVDRVLAAATIDAVLTDDRTPLETGIVGLAGPLYVASDPERATARGREDLSYRRQAAFVAAADGDMSSLTDRSAALLEKRRAIAGLGDRMLTPSQSVETVLTERLGAERGQPVDEFAIDAAERFAAATGGDAVAVGDRPVPDEPAAATEMRREVALRLVDLWRRVGGEVDPHPAPVDRIPENRTPAVQAVRDARRDGPTAFVETARDRLDFDGAPSVLGAAERVLREFDPNVRVAEAARERREQREVG